MWVMLGPHDGANEGNDKRDAWILHHRGGNESERRVFRGSTIAQIGVVRPATRE